LFGAAQRGVVAVLHRYERFAEARRSFSRLRPAIFQCEKSLRSARGLLPFVYVLVGVVVATKMDCSIAIGPVPCLLIWKMRADYRPEVAATKDKLNGNTR
jgi:hypothetical protein